MNYPTREEFERLEAGQKRIEAKQKRIEEEVRKIREQQTEPIRVTRLEIDQGGIQDQLKSVIQTQVDHSEKLDTLDHHMKDTQADIKVVKANQSDLHGYLDEKFKSVDEKFKSVEAELDAHREAVFRQLITLSANHTKRFDQIDATMATKDDLTTMATKDDLTTMATKDDLTTMATKDDLTTMATKEDITELKSLMIRLLQQRS
jgi:chromosome segregation ATPase